MLFNNNDEQRQWPTRAVVTAGMPYGNKPLHFGHIGGVFVPADAFARFLRDRIGAENVRFVCGTDCFGSPIDEGYRKRLEAGDFSGSIADYVGENHRRQRDTLESFQISLDIYEGSGIGQAGNIHQMVSDAFIKRLHEKGWLKRESTLQFFDPEAQIFLNGRQVVGRCPVQGCKSEHAYADECDLGHQYEPEDLIAPRSTVSDSVPEMKPVENWYFDLPAFKEFLETFTESLAQDEDQRAIVAQTLSEFLQPPIVYIKNEAFEGYEALAPELPAHVMRPAEKGKQSFEIEFETIEDRDKARPLLARAGLRFRTSKTLVPFRITGNITWGVRAPELEGTNGLTVWCWPESLWAPISFTIAVNDRLGLPRRAWEDFWCSEDATVFQFIGQDNLYFYGIAQPALFEALGEGDFLIPGDRDHQLSQTRLIANHHILFGDHKASSSGSLKPPTGEELLEHYTVDQLRAHFLALGLDQRSVGFKPKVFDPSEEKRNDPRVADPVLKEGALLTNVFNRLARSCFYEAQKNFDGFMPLGEVGQEVLERCEQVLATYDRLMHKAEFHSIMALMDEFIRASNKYWADGISRADREQDAAARRQVLLECFFLLRVATLLMHPIVPRGCEQICDYLNFSFDDFFSWNYDFSSMDELCTASETDEGRHRICELPPRFDFFKKHPSQMKD